MSSSMSSSLGNCYNFHRRNGLHTQRKQNITNIILTAMQLHLMFVTVVMVFSAFYQDSCKFSCEIVPSQHQKLWIIRISLFGFYQCPQNDMARKSNPTLQTIGKGSELGNFSKIHISNKMPYKLKLHMMWSSHEVVL